MRLEYLHANWIMHKSQTLNRPNGYSYKGIALCIFFHFHLPVTLTVGTKTLTTKPNACVIIDKNTPHSIKLDRAIVHDWMIFDGKDELAPMLERFGLSINTVYYPEHPARITEAVVESEQTFFVSDPLFEMIFETRLADILLELARSNRKREPAEIAMDNEGIPFKMHKLRKNFRESANLSLFTEARMISLTQCSRSTLFRRYRQLFGVSPKEDLHAECIQRAKKYLTETAFTVEHIAEILGYKSTVSFIRRFKHHTDMTPSEYRRTAKDGM